MKKLLLTLLTLTAGTVSAQLLQTENFNTLNLGNVGTDITGATPGQDNWLTFSSNGTAPTTGTNAANENFQIVATGNASSNGLKITSSDGNKGSRFMWKDGFDAIWATRTTGNNILEVEYDMYTGSATSSTAQVGVRLYGADGTNSRVLGGFVYNVGSRVLNGVAYLNNGGTFGTFLINLTAAPGLVLDADTWYRIGFAYNTTTGEVIFKTNTVYTGLNAANWVGPFDPTEVDFVSAVPSTNTVVSDLTFDNLTVKATATEGLLGTTEIQGLENTIAIYPNPTNNVVNVKGNNVGFTAVSFTDINGRVVKTVNVDTTSETEISISELNSGVYFMNITTDSGVVTKKIVKQ